MSGDSQDNLLKFSSFTSSVDPSFWHKITQLKLDVDKLSENIHQIWGYYNNKLPQGLNNLFSVDCTSFNNHPDESNVVGVGRIINKNTVESFKDEDKAKLLESEGNSLLDILKNDALENPNLLTRFLILSFADLKKYHYYYWFAFPVPSFLSCALLESPKSITECLNEESVQDLCSAYNGVSDIRHKSFFMLKFSEKTVKLFTVKEGFSNYEKGGKWFFGFADSCNETENPGWPLRNYLALISYHCKTTVQEPILVLALRLSYSQKGWSANNSKVFKLQIKVENAIWEKSPVGWVGWEKNDRGKMGPRFANLSSSMDPVKLAETSIDLNLKLMKWQLLPELNLDVIKNTKCLLLGSGTLGCVVARNLLSWGVRHITFVDSGKVSYSNPVRQFLFKFKDYGSYKAEAAALALKEIFPGVSTEGYVLSIPMPGHPVSESLFEETKTNVQQLEELIRTHDVIFLLMDSRESRWLPTLVAAAMEKQVINAALGFDSYLVMRHGLKSESELPNNAGFINGSKLGCYFCNDVTAPGNSGKARTLDQQCTVTRPGVSNMAGALAVELLTSLLQHPQQGLAPAESDQDLVETTSPLGIIPHSIRGFISHYRTVLPATEAFSSCVACSTKVVQEYKLNGFNFILKALRSKEYLEELSGLTDLHNESLMSEVLEYSSSEPDDC